MIRRFNRYELKYVLRVEKCKAIMDDLENYIRWDKHGGKEGYKLVSLYYDSRDLDFFWAKVEGLKFRRKVRLRIYPGDDITQVTKGLVEIKQRINRTVQKRRLVLPIEEAERLCMGNYDYGSLDEMDQQVAEEVTYLARSMDLRPSAITAYHRKAFEGDFENAGLRVTFDTQVASRIHALKVNAPAANHLVLPAEWCIMEVKANEAVPDWVTSLVARHDCQVQRVSKYCAGIAQLKKLNVLPIAHGPGVPLGPSRPHSQPKDPAQGADPVTPA